MFTQSFDEAAAPLTLETAAGRRNLFNQRIDQLMQPSRDPHQRTLTLDEALYALRTSEDRADKELLAAMGEVPTAARKERLQMDRFRTQMQETMEQNAKAAQTSPEVAKALAANDRRVAFNARLDELTTEGLSIDEAIDAMCANPADVELLAAMGAHAAGSKPAQGAPQTAKAVAANGRAVVFTSSEVPWTTEPSRAVATGVEPVRFVSMPSC